MFHRDPLTIESDAGTMEYIARKKQIEWEYAQPYLEPVAAPSLETEPERRQRVREALSQLPEGERMKLSADLRREYREIAIQEAQLE